ncbi:MAG: DUF2259 domain-containing protein [Spirochaetales bacterium]
MLPRVTRTALTVLLIGTAITVQAVAGDVARFVNLGFSSDDSVFMFAQYGVEQEASTPYAEIYTVDVEDNDFVPDGRFSRSSDRTVSAGHDGLGALHSLLHEARAIVTEYEIDHSKQGRIVYALLNEEDPGDTIDFRDFKTGNRYRAELIQERDGSGQDVRARFHIELDRETPDDESRTYTIGLPDFYRDGVESYKVHQAILSPDEQSLIFLVEVHRPTDSGTTVRYMVESVRL